MSIIARFWNGIAVGQNSGNGYINVTQLTQAYHQSTGVQKKPSHWYENKRTQESIAYLESVTGIPASQLIITIRGGDTSQQGTWIHPKLAISFAMWLSVELEFTVYGWVEDWITQESTNYHRHSLYWYDRLTLFNQRTHIPRGWFCIFKEIADFVSQMEAQGYQLADDARLDASVGRHFCKYLRTIGIEPEEVCMKYPHWYPGYDFPVKANLYPLNLLEIFRQWFEDVYLMSHVKAYFKGRKDQQGLAAVNRCLLLLAGG